MANFLSTLVACLSVLSISMLFPAEAQSQESRTWTDKTGGFSVSAVLDSEDVTSVRLTTADGRQITVPKSKLSEGDLNFLKSKQAAKSEPSASDVESLLTKTLAGSTVTGSANDTLQDFVSRLNVNVFVDLATLAEIGLSPNVPIDSSSQAKSLAEQLDAVLSNIELTWYRLRTVLVICTRDGAERRALDPMVYRIPIPRNDFTSVSSKIQAVQPDSWEALGGSGSIQLLPGAVVIMQTPEVHRKLASQLSLRATPRRYIHPLDDEMVSVNIVGGTLRSFAQELEMQVNRKIVVSDSNADRQAPIAKLVHVSAKDALDLVLGQVDCHWLENSGGLQIATRSEAKSNLEPRTISVAFASPPVASLITNALMSVVAPDSWQPLGGAGTIAFAGGKSFNISQTQPVYRTLGQLLAELGNSPN